MAWTYGTRVNGGGQAFLNAINSSWTFSYGASVAAGTLVVLHVAVQSSLRTPTSVTDDAGNTWTVDQSTTPLSSGQPASVIMSSVLDHAVTTANRISVTAPISGSATSYFTYTVDTFFNTAPAAQVQDGGAGNMGTATTTSTGDTPAPSDPGELCLAGFAWSAATVSMTGFQAGYTGLAAVSYGGVQGKLLYNLSVSTSQNVAATLSSNVSWAAAAQLYSSAVLGANYPIELDASESVGASLSIRRGYLRPALVASVVEHASLGKVKSRILRASVAEVARMTKVPPPRRLQTSVSVVPTLTYGRVYAIALTASVSTVPSLKITTIKKLPTSVHIAVVSLTRRPGKTFKIAIKEIAGINKKGTYKQPPAVLQLYDLTNVYLLPVLKGATVSYVHGIFGAGVMFDIYEAYVLAGGAFYVTDNGLKEALDRHPALARVF